MRHKFLLIIRRWFMGRGIFVARARGRYNRFQEFIDDRLMWERVGTGGDGGYWLPSFALEKKNGVIYSPGVSDKVSFETDMLEHGYRCHLIDGTIENVPTELHADSFTRKNLGAFNDAQTTTFEKWLYDVGIDTSSFNILQMDIEGSEYPILLNTPSSILSKFDIIIIEFHFLDYFLLDPFYDLFIKPSFQKMEEHHYLARLDWNKVQGVFKDCDGHHCSIAIECVFLKSSYK